MDINTILKKINLIKLLHALKIQNITDVGDNLMGLCPFHVEKNSSWGIHKKTGRYNCFSCGEKGNVISLIAKIKGFNKKEAVNYLCKIAGIRKGNVIVGIKTIYRQLKKIMRNKKKQIVKQERQYHVELPLHLNNNYFGGIQYFKRRGIYKHTLLKHHISFCLDGFYNNRAIIPIMDKTGRLLSFEARDIIGLQEKKVLYPHGTKVNNTLYNLQNAKKQKEVIIVEGLMDTLYLAQRGFNVVSTFGVNMSEQQEILLSQYFKRVYIAFDGDRAGYKGMIKCGSMLSMYLSVYVITLKKNTDPDSYSKEEFTALKNKAVDIQTYLSAKYFKKIHKV